MTCQQNILQDYKEFNNSESVQLGDGRTVNALGAGRIKVSNQLPCSRESTGWITDVLYVPKLTSNSFSVHTAALKGHDFIWTQAMLDPKQEREVCGNWFSIWIILRAQLSGYKAHVRKCKICWRYK